MTKQPAPAPPTPPLHGGEPVDADVLHAWMVLTRSDIASNVAALNDRLTSIRNAAGELATAPLNSEQRLAVARIDDDVKRMAAALSHLARQVNNIVPDALPRVPGPATPADVRSAHILVVEDDDAVRGAMARLLMRLGHQVTSCANGVEALEVVQLGPVDCVVSDFRMPTLGGRGLYQQVEEQWPTLASRFVFVTGDVGDPRTLEFLRHTAQPVVTKPYEVQDLLAAITGVLDRAGLARRA